MQRMTSAGSLHPQVDVDQDEVYKELLKLADIRPVPTIECCGHQKLSLNYGPGLLPMAISRFSSLYRAA